MNDIELQPLPRRSLCEFDGAVEIDLYTKEQMQSYALAAVEADRAHRVPEGCYLSWGGFNIHGDSKSIQEVNRLMHEAGTVPDLKAMLAQSYKELAKEAPELCDPSCKTYDVAAMVMSDCGHSTNNQRLLDRIAARIDKHVESLLASTPAPAQQETSPIKAEHKTVTPSGTVVTRLELTDKAKESLRANVTHIPGFAQHQEPPQQERKPMTEEQVYAMCARLGLSQLSPLDLVAEVERHHGIKE